MRENPAVNRRLRDTGMDHVDHALGRPVWPLRETYRNHFAIGIGQKLALEFEASPHWRRMPASGSMAFYEVTDAGRQALADYLATLDPGERRRAFVVTYEGHDVIVPARSRAHARYVNWLRLSDCFCELTFGEFVRRSRVRLAT